MSKRVDFCRRNAKSIQNFIKQTYDIDVKFTNVFSWGYNSASIYVLDKKDNAFVARVREYNRDAKEKLHKEIFFADYFKDLFITPKFVKSKKDESITYFKGHTFLIHKHISGIAPFDMDLEILAKACIIAHSIHQLEIPDYPLVKFKSTQKYDPKLLHGDITPYNLLTENNDLVALLDYEEVMTGPIERDLARLCLISWFKMAESTDIMLSTCVDAAINAYPTSIDRDYLASLIKEQLNERISNINKNKINYPSDTSFRQELDYVEQFMPRIDI